MSDLIDRQAVEALPLAEVVPVEKASPEKRTDKRTETHECDLIRRQAAIEALGEKPLVWDDLSDFYLGKAAQWSDDVDAIMALPSAQPITEEDYIELHDRFGIEVESVVRDMVSGEGKRWEI